MRYQYLMMLIFLQENDCHQQVDDLFDILIQRGGNVFFIYIYCILK